MKERVLAELQRIERVKNVRVLLAVESGSRAWGFASPDSDYDVRFVYVNPREWYLSLFEHRDVIEEMLPGDLDVSGWDLRKALRLFCKCNLAFNEWLLSPQTYFEVGSFRAQLVQLIPQFFNPIAGIQHYRRTAESSLNEHLTDGRIKIKKLFYVLRPLLACRWIKHRRDQPPTEFRSLVASDWVTADEQNWIEGLLSRKAAAQEAELIDVAGARVDAIRVELDGFRDASLVPPPTKSATDVLDDLLRAWTREQ
jgi:predicted nucleotidyltransferase